MQKPEVTTYVTANKGTAKRILSYISFMLSSIFLGLPTVGRKYDVVVATSPQFFVACAGHVISTWLGRPFVFELRDIWPASIVAVGALTNRLVIRTLERIEMMLYRRAKAICAVADSYVDILERRGVDPGKIFVVKNGVDLERFRPDVDSAAVRDEFGLAGKFVVTYIGTIGMAHGLDVVLEAADRGRGDVSVVYMLVGTGARHDELESRAKKMGLSNVIFAGRQPRERVPEFLAASGAVLVHLKAVELFRHVIPSKIFEIMGCARPLVMGVAGEAADIIAEADAGVMMEPENADSLLSAVATLKSDPALRKRLGASGRAYVEANFDRNALAADYAQHLTELTAESLH